MRGRLAFVAIAAAIVAIGFVAARDLRRGYWTTRGLHVERFTLRSRLVGRDVHEVLVIPPGGGDGRPLLVFLHGRGGPAASNLSQPLFDELHRLRRRGPGLFPPDGGGHSSWHAPRDRRWGSDLLGRA